MRNQSQCDLKPLLKSTMFMLWIVVLIALFRCEVGDAFLLLPLQRFRHHFSAASSAVVSTLPYTYKQDIMTSSPSLHPLRMNRLMMMQKMVTIEANEEEDDDGDDDDDDEEEEEEEEEGGHSVVSDDAPAILEEAQDSMSLEKEGIKFSSALNGSDVRIGIIMGRWNADVIQGLYKVRSCSKYAKDNCSMI